VIDRLLKNQNPLENRNNLRSSSPHPGPGQISGNRAAILRSEIHRPGSHGCSYRSLGSGDQLTWVAAFILDSFSGRGISNTANDQSQLDSLAMLVDAYRALGILAQHPRLTICYWPARSPSGLPPISIPKGLGRFGSVAQEPMVRRLPAGGRRIRTVGPSRESIGPLLPTGIPWRSNRKSCDRSIPDERARNPFASPVRPSASEIAA
jgi:hypothetical protein